MSFVDYLRNYLPVLLWAGFIFFLSSQSTLPGPETNLADFLFKKSAHMFVYAVLFFFTFRGMNKSKSSTKSLMYLPLLFCILYAVSDEWHQSFVPGRFPTVRDIGYDSIGASIAWLRSFKYI